MQACQDPLKIGNSTGFSVPAEVAVPSNGIAFQESFRQICSNSIGNPVTQVKEVHNLHKTSTCESINPALTTELSRKKSGTKSFPGEEVK